jgi:high-affinity K+ transport system ATPase subunit B
MSADELQELHEHAEHAAHDRSMAPVSLTMATLAVLVAVASLLGHRAHTEEVILQNKSTDQWAYYQAKSIRRHTDELFADFASVMATGDPKKLAELREKYQGEANAYRDQQNEIEADARKLEQETNHERRRADRFDLAEVFLEVGLVVTSITLLSGKRVFWKAGILFGAVGMAVAGTAPLVR